MSDLYPVAGCKIYIGGVHATQATDFAEADFNSESWVEIDGWDQMGAFGDTAALITQPLINRGRDLKQKGTANAGQMQNVFSVIAADGGQTALLAAGAAAVKSNYAFKILFNDPTGSPATASKAYFIGLVMSAANQGGEANTIRKINSTIEINSNIVLVAAG